ncbi:hypothetical protein [endosymbiont of Acanthamoeba sp. UWC8]|uniref:hypothetical protein n=1 Tax=endosymbiont of Acanthamoeba sp. UWC8 TaxID=86106 RepID=UPI0011DD01B5|nr:hypothetical protein [endosymbiont of Acanthamoeba sp. UWC8]
MAAFIVSRNDQRKLYRDCDSCRANGFGINGPASAYSAAGWSIFSVDPYGSPYPQGQYLQIGGFHPGGPSDNPLLFPTDAYVVDNKIDDGYPRRGLVYADFNDCYSAPKTLDSLYNYDLNSQVCILKFIFRK